MCVTRGARLVAPWLLLGLALPLPAELRQDADLDELLRRAGAYIADYERRIPGVVSEEDYVQLGELEGWSGAGSIQQRRLRSDVAVIAVPEVGWAYFRDVYEVDGRPVRDREERLTRLFLTPGQESLSQARRIVEESARFNLNMAGSVLVRTVNNPMMALRFLRARNQSRSRFSLEGTTTIDGVRAVVLRFKEDTLPRLIMSGDDAAAGGRFWIEPESGRFVRSELAFETTNQKESTTVRSVVRVRFADVDDAGLWVPVEMNEEHRASGRGAIRFTGRATYGKVRTFRVEVETIIKER